MHCALLERGVRVHGFKNISMTVHVLFSLYLKKTQLFKINFFLYHGMEVDGLHFLRSSIIM